MVPAAINTYLREYQREGVRFFWDLYNEGRGGLLGDDMGLVRNFLHVLLALRFPSHCFDSRVSADCGMHRSISNGMVWQAKPSRLYHSSLLS